MLKMNEKNLKTLGFVLRSIWYILKIAIAGLVVVSLMIVGFISGTGCCKRVYNNHRRHEAARRGRDGA